MNEQYQDPYLENNSQEESEIDWAELVGKLLQHKKFIILSTILFFIIGCGFALMQKRKWVVNVTMAPEVQVSTRSTGLNGIASMLGIGNAALGNSTDAVNITLFPEICSSTPFLASLFNVPVTPYVPKKKIKEGAQVKTITLYDFITGKYKPKSAFKLWMESWLGAKEEEEQELDLACLNREQAIVVNALSRSISANVDKKSGVTTLTVTMSDPKIATQVADTVCRKLQQYVSEYRTQKAEADYDYFKNLSLEAKERMVQAQAAYAARVDYDRSVILQSVNSEKERLQQEASLAQQLYSQMKQQEEMAKAKVQEMKPVFAVVQPATQPQRPANSRKIVALGWAFFGFILSAGWKVYLKDFIANFKEKMHDKKLIEE